MPDLNAIHAEVTDWKFDAAFELPEIPEPSGLCYCELTGTIFVVDDGGTDRPAGLHEIDLDGNYLRGTTFGADLEGVTYCGDDQNLYICDEADETIHVVNPETLHIMGDFKVSPMIQENRAFEVGGNGFEGIAWMPGSVFGTACGALRILNQDDPAGIGVIPFDRIQLGETVEFSSFGSIYPQRNCGELYIDANAMELWIVNSWLNTVRIEDLKQRGVVKRWEVMPGMAQEGLTFDPQGRMWIGQDIGGVVRYVKGG